MIRTKLGRQTLSWPGYKAHLRILYPLVIYVFQVESVNMPREITQQGKKNVYTQIDTTARDEEDSEWRNEDLRSR